MKAKGTQLSPQLQSARSELGDMLAAKDKATDTFVLGMEDRLLVIDRLIKIEALEHKMGIGKAGSAFDDDGEDD